MNVERPLLPERVALFSLISLLFFVFFLLFNVRESLPEPIVAGISEISGESGGGGGSGGDSGAGNAVSGASEGGAEIFLEGPLSGTDAKVSEAGIVDTSKTDEPEGEIIPDWDDEVNPRDVLAKRGAPVPKQVKAPKTGEIRLSAVGGGAGKGTGQGQGAGAGKGVGIKEGAGGATGASFYGMEVTGTQILFILDHSGSMQSFSDGDNRLDILKKELTAMLDVFTAPPPKALPLQKTKSDTRSRGAYRFLFFSDETLVFPSHGMIRMNNMSEKGKAVDWIKSIEPAGGTHMVGAFEDAKKLCLAYPIDTIYFLSDGEPNSSYEEVLDCIRSWNPPSSKQVVIQCISVGQESELLKKIAAENKGKYSSAH